MLIKCRFFVVTLLLFYGLVNAQTQDTAGLFKAVVPVLSQSKSDKKYAEQKGLQEVLVRMSGSEEVLFNEVIKRAVGNAHRYIEQFQYRLVDDEVLQAKGYKQALAMMFSPELIEKLLMREARVSYWPPNRPNVLVWLVEDDARYGKQMLNPEAQNPITLSMDKVATDKGLPLIYPLLDLDDQMTMSADVLWRMDEDSIRAASARYDAEVILVGRFTTTSKGELWSSWQYLHQSKGKTWDSRAKDMDKLAWEALMPLTDYLVTLTSVVPSDEGAIVLLLQGIDNFRHYRRALDYFEGLAMVSDISLLAARPGELLLALKSEATLGRFKTTVELDKQIEFMEQQSDLPVWQQRPQGTMDNPVLYHWLKS